MEVFQNGAADPEPAEKVSDAVPVRQAVAVDAATLDGYPGAYELAPGFEITVTREGETLFGQGTGQPRFALTPEGGDVFALPQVGAVLTFLRGADGRVDRLQLAQGGQQVVGPRKGR